MAPKTPQRPHTGPLYTTIPRVSFRQSPSLSRYHDRARPMFSSLVKNQGSNGRIFQPGGRGWLNSRRRSPRVYIFILAVTALFGGMLILHHIQPPRLFHTHTNSEPQAGVFPPESEDPPPSSYCSFCDCNQPDPPFAGSVLSNAYPQLQLYTDLRSSKSGMNLDATLYKHIMSVYCSHQHLTKPQSMALLTRGALLPETVMAWSLTNLTRHAATIYLTTATSPNSRTGEQRPAYIQRHGKAIRAWLDEHEADHRAGSGDTRWQVIWLVVEDSTELSPTIASALKQSDVPFVYLAYGQTSAWGNAQKNAVLQLVHKISHSSPSGADDSDATAKATATDLGVGERGLFAHGPVYGLDDDNKITPSLLSILTRVDRIGVFPVGNFQGRWESPTISDDGVVTGSDSPWGNRDFPFDYGGYVFNSSLLGTVVEGPMFWTHEGFGGEDVFMRRVVGELEGLEPLCLEEVRGGSDCHFVWHNMELEEAEKVVEEEGKGSDALERETEDVYGDDGWEAKNVEDTGDAERVYGRQGG